MPGSGGGGVSVPDTGGGVVGAHPCPLALYTERLARKIQDTIQVTHSPLKRHVFRKRDAPEETSMKRLGIRIAHPPLLHSPVLVRAAIIHLYVQICNSSGTEDG